MSKTISKKDLIIEKSFELFSKYGYEGATLDELAKVCGITKPAIYYYFKDKASLYEAVVCSQFAYLEERILSQTDRGEATERLRNYIKTFGEFLIKSPFFSAIFSREITAGADTLPSSCADRLSGILKRLVEILELGERDGVFERENPFMVQMMIVTPLTAYHVSRPLREKIAKRLDNYNLIENVEFQDIVDKLSEKIIKALTC